MKRQVSGMTLIETILVIAILALLVTLLVPAVSGARAQALRATNTARLSSHAAVFAAYSTDYRECFPYYVDPSATLQSIQAGGQVHTFSNYFDAIFFWQLALADAYYDSSVRSPSFCDAELARNAYRAGTEFWYPCVFFARPNFWNQTTRTGGDQWGVNYVFQCTFPSRKTVLLSPYRLLQPLDDLYLDRPAANPIPVALADGSARYVAESHFLRGVPTGEGASPGTLHHQDLFVGLHTIGGVNGADVP